MFGLKRIVAVVAFFSMCSLFGGCASIVHGSSQTVGISSEPPGATIRIDNGMMLTTPSSVKLQRNRDYIITISKDGYQTQTVPLNSVLSGWLAGNIIFGGIIGGAVDAATGAAFTLTPENITITLSPLKPGESPGDASVVAMTTQQKLDALESLYSQGVLTEKEYAASKTKLNEDLKKEITGGGSS